VQKIIFKYGEREILKTAASTKAQNLPAKSLDGQIKAAKFRRKSRQGAIKSCEFILTSVVKFYLLMPNDDHFQICTKGGVPCKLSRP